jgi:hypothetical protein
VTWAVGAAGLFTLDDGMEWKAVRMQY